MKFAKTIKTGLISDVIKTNRKTHNPRVITHNPIIIKGFKQMKQSEADKTHDGLR